MRCPRCEADTPDGIRFCIECAAPLTRRCLSCGVANLPQAKFCGQRATSFTGQTPGASPSSSCQPPLSYTPAHLTVKNVLLINAVLTMLLLRETYAGSTHDTRIADATPYPLPAGSRLLQDLGFLAFTLDRVEIIMPTRKPRGRQLTRAQKATNRRIARRRVRIEHVNSSVKRCRIVHDICRLRKVGVRDLVMEVCCALHNFRVRLTPWQPMV
jgi:hypothetical protein